jgi:hypothetical protein
VKSQVNNLKFLITRILFRKEVILMVDVYIALIVKKLRTINQVPTQLQAEVLAGLNALGLDGYGNPLQTEPTTQA